MVGLRAQNKIDKIMGDAFERARDVLFAEARKLFGQTGARYSRFVLAVGWGPTLFTSEGHIVEGSKVEGCAKARRFLDYATDFYDRFGGDNSEVLNQRMVTSDNRPSRS